LIDVYVLSGIINDNYGDYGDDVYAHILQIGRSDAKIIYGRLSYKPLKLNSNRAHATHATIVLNKTASLSIS